jgi:hypothetical protein
MGLKPGEKIERLGQIRVVSVIREPLSELSRSSAYGNKEAGREGFPGMTGHRFASMFCQHMGTNMDEEVTRIEFEYVDVK